MLLNMHETENPGLLTWEWVSGSDWGGKLVDSCCLPIPGAFPWTACDFPPTFLSLLEVLEIMAAQFISYTLIQKGNFHLRTVELLLYMW